MLRSCSYRRLNHGATGDRITSSPRLSLSDRHDPACVTTFQGHRPPDRELFVVVARFDQNLIVAADSVGSFLHGVEWLRARTSLRIAVISRVAGGIAIHSGASGTVADAIEQFKAGALKQSGAADVEAGWV